VTGRIDKIPAVVSIVDGGGWDALYRLEFLEDISIRNGDTLVISDELWEEEGLVEVSIERVGNEGPS